MPERKPIFYDQERLRWRRTRRVLEITGGLFTLILIIFVRQRFSQAGAAGYSGGGTRTGIIHAIPGKLKTKPAPRGRKRKVAALGKLPQNYDPLRAAFYVGDDPTSLASLQVHYHDIDLLIPEALHAVSLDGRLDVDQDPKLCFLQMQTSGVEIPIMSMVNNYNGKEWLVGGMAEMLARPDSRERLSKELAGFATSQHQPGMVVDFEQVPESSQKDFRAFHSRPRRGHARRQPEIDGGAACRGLELRLQIPGGAG